MLRDTLSDDKVKRVITHIFFKNAPDNKKKNNFAQCLVITLSGITSLFMENLFYDKTRYQHA